MVFYTEHEIAMGHPRTLIREEVDVDAPPPYPYEEEVAVYDRKRRVLLEQRDATGTTSLIQSIVIGLVGLVSASGVGIAGLQIALATLRIATMAAAAGVLGVGTLGAGYLVVEGGVLVLQRTKPGFVATVKAANQVARDAREGCLRVYQRAENGALTAIRELKMLRKMPKPLRTA